MRAMPQLSCLLYFGSSRNEKRHSLYPSVLDNRLVDGRRDVCTVQSARYHVCHKWYCDCRPRNPIPKLPNKILWYIDKQHPS